MALTLKSTLTNAQLHHCTLSTDGRLKAKAHHSQMDDGLYKKHRRVTGSICSGLRCPAVIDADVNTYLVGNACSQRLMLMCKKKICDSCYGCFEQCNGALVSMNAF